MAARLPDNHPLQWTGPGVGVASAMRPVVSTGRPRPLNGFALAGHRMELPKIPVERFSPLRGKLSFYRAEKGAQVNIDIPLAPFDSSQPQDDQPIDTAFELVLYLPIDTIEQLDEGVFVAQGDDCDSSIYLGTAHNPVDVSQIRFQRLTNDSFRIACELVCDFAFEGVGQPAVVTLETAVDIGFDGKAR